MKDFMLLLVMQERLPKNIEDMLIGTLINKGNIISLLYTYGNDQGKLYADNGIGPTTLGLRINSNTELTIFELELEVFNILDALGIKYYFCFVSEFSSKWLSRTSNFKIINTNVQQIEFIKDSKYNIN